MGLINSIGAWFERITDGWRFGTEISKLIFTKNVEIQGTDDMPYTHEFQNKDGLVAHVEDIDDAIGNINLGLPDGLLEGGIVQWRETGYDYRVSTAKVKELGVIDFVQTVDFTLTPSDPTNDRIDTVVVSLEFGFQVLIGTPSPAPVEPQPTGNQIRLTAIPVSAASTAPSGITTTVVYKENLEYTVTHIGAGTSNPDDTSNPFEDLKAVNVSNVENGSTTLFTAPADVTVSTINSSSFRLDLKQLFGNGHNLAIQFFNNADVAVSDSVILSINKTDLNYQFVAFAFNQFNFGGNTTFRKIALRFVRTGNQQTRQGYFIDNFILQGGITQPPISVTPEHNQLQGLQGGTPTERYHLTKDQHDAALNANTPSAINPFLTELDIEDINYTLITYNQLTSLINTNSLEEGLFYLISDFRTRHQITNTTDIHEGAIEPLVVLATSVSTISENAYSLIHTKDEIKYDSANDAFSTHGKITFRRNVQLDTYTHYDFREVRFRRFKILSKQEEEITSLTSNTLDCLLTFSTGTNLAGTFFNTNRRLHMQVGAITHDAGTLTLTIRKGTGSITKPLLKYDGTPWLANELANTSGILTNCLVRDAYVFMNYRAAGWGKEIVGTYSSHVSGTYVIGNGLRYIVDPLDFTDYLTFNNTYFGVHLDKFNSAIAGNNIVFLNTVSHCHIGNNNYNVTFRGAVFNLFSGHELYNNIFAGEVRWSTFRKELIGNYFGIGFNHCNINEHINDNTIYPPQFGFIVDFQVAGSTIHFNGSFVRVHNFIENSAIFLNGQFGSSGRGSTIITSIITNSLLGYFNADSLILNKRLLNTSFYEVPAVHNYVRSLNVQESPTPTGTVKMLGWDEKGNVIRTELESFPDYEPDTGNIKFSPLNGKPRKYGYDVTPLSGNIVFETTGAKETTMPKFRWNDGTLPTVSVSGGGVTLIKIGDFEVSVDNFVECICHKNNAGTVTHIAYSINKV